MFAGAGPRKIPDPRQSVSHWTREGPVLYTPVHHLDGGGQAALAVWRDRPESFSTHEPREGFHSHPDTRSCDDRAAAARAGAFRQGCETVGIGHSPQFAEIGRRSPQTGPSQLMESPHTVVRAPITIQSAGRLFGDCVHRRRRSGSSQCRCAAGTICQAAVPGIRNTAGVSRQPGTDQSRLRRL